MSDSLWILQYKKSNIFAINRIQICFEFKLYSIKSTYLNGHDSVTFSVSHFVDSAERSSSNLSLVLEVLRSKVVNLEPNKHSQTEDCRATKFC